MADLSEMFATLNTALAQGVPDAPPAASADPSAASSPATSDQASSTVARGSSVHDTIAALGAALNQPQAAPAPAAPAPRAASPYGALDRSAFGASRVASAPAPQAAPSGDGAADALNAVEGTGRENYDTGPAEDGLTPGQRAAGIPGLAGDMLIQAGTAMPVVGSYLEPAAARLASTFNGRSVEQNIAQLATMDADFAAKHPGLTMTSRLAGGVIGTAPLIAAAPEAFGLGGGSLLARGAAAVGSNAALSGADAAARGEDIGKAAEIGGALGALGPAAEVGAAGVRAVGGAVGKTVGPIIAGMQLRGAAPGDIDALANKAEREAAQETAAAEALSTDKARAAELKGRNAADTDRTGAALAQRRADDRAADVANREATIPYVV